VDEDQNRNITDFRMDLERILQKLTPFVGQVVKDYFFENLKEKEIALKYNVTQQYISKI
jgi:DNA-directed RNA polymerase specialized sigma subunit